MTTKGNPSITEKIPERRFIVYKTSIDPTVIKLAVEAIKKDSLAEMGFLKTNLEDIQCVSIDRYYEPYIFLDGKYSIDYYSKYSFTLKVDEDPQEIIILGKKFRPKIVNDPENGDYGEITLEARKHFLHEKKVNLILDKAGREVPFEQMPIAASEEDPKKILDAFKEKVEELQVAPNEEIEILRSKIAKRPTEIEKIATELFEVSERAVIYTPIYGITFQNTETGEKKIVKMDGVTARIKTDSSEN